MVVPTIAMYASPPSSVCSAPYQTTAISDFDLVNTRVAASSTASSTASSHKPMVGGLSYLFSARHAPSEELVVGPILRGDELKELKGFKFFGGAHHLSPVSVLQSPLSCSSSPSVSGSSPLRVGRGSRATGLFNGFVTHALGSYGVAYDAPPSDDGIDEEELPFNMEDGSVESGDHEPHVKSMLLDAQSRHEIFSDEFVVKAFYEAEKAHRGQMRASGDPYLKHCVETAILLGKIGANSTIVSAGLLHDTLDDSSLCYVYIRKTFGAGVADLVKGVSELSHLSKLARDNNTASKDNEADILRTLLLSMADPRAVLIKMADRLHNMMTLDALPLIKQRRFAKETLEIFVPLANRLGIYTWKVQLENLCFKHLNPDEHRELSSRLLDIYDEAIITSVTEKLGNALNDEAVPYKDLYGRDKSLYSIRCKMLKKNLKMDEVHDIHGIRLIVENKEDCYTALEVVHGLWSEVPGKFKDYISEPKCNGYQSLHTVVRDEGGVPIEVQIRTEEMNSQAEFGLAAHWRYKEGDWQHSKYLRGMVEWARWIITWQCETMNKERSSTKCGPPCAFPTHSDDCPFSYKSQSGQDGPVLVIMMENEKMTLKEFPANSTVMDLLEGAGRGVSRWSPYGYPVREELRLKLNDKLVYDPTCKLKMGDVVQLTRAIPDEDLTEVRREMQRMLDCDLTTVSRRS